MELFGNDPLAAFLRAAAQHPFAWGQHDCLLFLADWVFQRTGADPAGEFRGAYATEGEAKRLIVRAGGMAALIDRRMPGKRTEEPERGDIGLIDTLPGGETGGIVLAGSTAVIGKDGLMIVPFSRSPVIAAWRV